MTPLRLKPLLAFTALWLLVLAPAAGAHAVLQGTSPARGTTVEKQPDLIAFRFSEPVEGSFGAVRVFDPAGGQVQSGDVVRPQGQKSVGVHLRSGLREGSYTATFRVISADGHPVSGGFVFSVGRPSTPSKTVAQLTSGGNTGHITQVGYGIARGITYGAIGLGIGGLIFLIVVWLPGLRSVAGGDVRWRDASERFATRLRTLLVAALTAGTFGEAAQIVFQGATGAGTSFWDAFNADVVREVIDTRFGTVHLLAAGAFLGGLVLLATARGRVPVLRPASLGAAGLAMGRALTRIDLTVALLLFGFLAISPALAGHASTQSPSGLLIPTDILHVLAMSSWVGGLLVLVLVLPAATRQLEPPDRSRLLASVLMRFSPLALGSVVVLVASGLIQSYVHVRSLHNLVDTGFGRAVLIKMGLMVGLIALGAYNQRGLLPRLKQLARGGRSPYKAGLALRRSLRAEIALLAVVLGVTAALVSYAPPVATGGGGSGPFAATKELGPVQMQMTVDPARVGGNEMHLFLISARDGSQFTGTKQLTVLLRLPAKRIGPIKPKPQKAGPGHYVLPAVDFVPAGDWEVDVIDRVSEFDQYETKVNVPIK